LRQLIGAGDKTTDCGNCKAKLRVAGTWPALIFFLIISSFTTLIPILLFPNNLALQMISLIIAIIVTFYISVMIFYDLKAVGAKAQNVKAS
jgi:hypothetical protein